MSVMVWCGLTENGPTRPYFVKPGDTIDSKYYVRRILPFAKREGQRLFESRDWVFQQDGATPHTSDLSQNWCKRNLLFFVPKQHWPPQSPDLNPLDYYFWNEVVRNMQRQQYTNLDSFMAEIVRGFEAVSLDGIQNAISSFPTRVRKVGDNQGKHTHNIGKK